MSSCQPYRNLVQLSPRAGTLGRWVRVGRVRRLGGDWGWDRYPPWQREREESEEGGGGRAWGIVHYSQGPLDY